MMYYLNFNESRELSGRYIKGVHTIPAGALEVSYQDFRSTIAKNNGTWSLRDDGSPMFTAFPDSTVDVAALIAEARYQHEAAGIVVGNMAIDTDRESQSKMTAAMLRADRDPSYTIDWKTGDGSFVTLEAALVTSIADLVDRYVQACFSREAELADALAKGTYSETDLASGWPVREYAQP